MDIWYTIVGPKWAIKAVGAVRNQKSIVESHRVLLAGRDPTGRTLNETITYGYATHAQAMDGALEHVIGGPEGRVD